METIPCIFGHGPSDEVAIEEDGFKGRRCRTCGLIYISPRPLPEEIFDLYHHDKAYWPADHHLQEKPVTTLAAKHHLRILRRLHPPPASILEIGCGGGHFLRAARDAGYEAHGIELNPMQAEYLRAKLSIPCESEPLSASTFGGRRFDIIYHVDVASHFPDPIQDFSVMRQKLNTGGLLFFETGNGADIDPKFYKYFSSFQYPDHLFFFGDATVKELLVRAGFKREHIQIRAYSTLPIRKFVSFLSARKQRSLAPSGSTTDSVPIKESAPKHTPLWKARVLHWLKYGLGRWVTSRSHPMTFLISAKNV